MDGQTDRRTELPWHICSIAYVLSRVKMVQHLTINSICFIGILTVQWNWFQFPWLFPDPLWNSLIFPGFPCFQSEWSPWLSEQECITTIYRILAKIYGTVKTIFHVYNTTKTRQCTQFFYGHYTSKPVIQNPQLTGGFWWSTCMRFLKSCNMSLMLQQYFLTNHLPTYKLTKWVFS